MKDERRTKSRHNLNLNFTANIKDASFSCEIVNISRGGTLILTGKEFQVGQTIGLELILRDEEIFLFLKGQIVWESRKKEQYLYGLRFICVEQMKKAKRNIWEFITGRSTRIQAQKISPEVFLRLLERKFDIEINFAKQLQKREFSRFLIEKSFVPNISDQNFLCTIKNVSLGGMRISTRMDFKLNTTFGLEINIPDEGVYITLFGEIVWKEEHVDVIDYGLKFLNENEMLRRNEKIIEMKFDQHEKYKNYFGIDSRLFKKLVKRKYDLEFNMYKNLVSYERVTLWVRLFFNAYFLNVFFNDEQFSILNQRFLLRAKLNLRMDEEIKVVFILDNNQFEVTGKVAKIESDTDEFTRYGIEMTQFDSETVTTIHQFYKDNSVALLTNQNMQQLNKPWI